MSTTHPTAPRAPVERGAYAKRGLRYSLRTLREAVGKTQTEVAEVAEMTQGEVSRLEAREDVRRSTLARYARALGGRLRVSIEIDGRSYELEG